MSNCLPKVLRDEGGCVLTFGPIPFWQGVQTHPSVRKTYPLSLRAESGKPIRQVSDVAVIDAVLHAYESDAYAFITPPPGASAWANSLGDSSIAAVIEAVGTGKPRTILEIGAGSGYVARELIDRYQPQRYVIVDPTIHEAIENVEVIREYFPCPKIGKERFDLILAFNCLEHVPDPVAFLGHIRSQLMPEGKVVLIFPECERQLRNGDLNVLIHEHLSYFTDGSARQIIAESGFTIEALEARSDTLFAFMSKSDSPSRLFPDSDSVELISQSAVAFKTALADTADSIRRHLDIGLNVGFHGATNGLNIFLHLSGLGDHTGIRIYDGDDSKHGLFLPACTAPIMSPANRSYKENGLLVISAMSYFDPIARFAFQEHGLSKDRLMPLARL
jgi:SAM-dependent methyltransferase